MNAPKSFVWFIGRESFQCTFEDGACPFCLRRAVVRLPPPLAAVQPDGTTHVCHPAYGGCNHGFSDERPQA